MDAAKGQDWIDAHRREGLMRERMGCMNQGQQGDPRRDQGEEDQQGGPRRPRRRPRTLTNKDKSVNPWSIKSALVWVAGVGGSRVGYVGGSVDCLVVHCHGFLSGALWNFQWRPLDR